uniref:Uncharacterized protein n=1 Tax=Chromera velia CCMP2878 TaxID=1169474 RepID=A0A0G4HVE3_9ALVE|eukprot:Cvel_8842.t1-p1 / transcript=Cvel_8842.t1 / gene=Cvel_8842 / organism=Chromera_velia_CCMP2878 / gene_product=hypothetical protein / transcript_product=hypothetical protein / location=Cvel_scaffold496:25545-26168(-) / protein_length=208 / sequence_SO=supercontig / SO=protein_coding / is_pseudo=false
MPVNYGAHACVCPCFWSGGPIATLENPAFRGVFGGPGTGLEGEVMCMSFSPDGNTLAAATTSGKVILWNVGTPQVKGQPFVLDRPRGSVIRWGTFSPDFQWFAFGSLVPTSSYGMYRDKQLNLWRVGAPVDFVTTVYTWEGTTTIDSPHWPVVFSQDSRTLVYNDSCLRSNVVQRTLSVSLRTIETGEERKVRAPSVSIEERVAGEPG